MVSTEYMKLFTQSFLNRDLTSNLGKLWSLFCTQRDEIEAQIVLLKNILSINDNSGITLDRIGNLLNEARTPGKADSAYRLDLLVSILSKNSGGTIPELVSIGRIIAGNDTSARFLPYELWQDDGTAFLDASDVMDGHGLFTPNTGEPAAIQSTLEGHIDTIEVPTEVGSAIDKVRAGGIYAKFNIVYVMPLSDMTLYAGDVNQATEIALGDGATRDPQPGDTGLENEVYRQTVGVSVNDDGDYQYSVFIYEDELNTDTINEMALFDNAGVMIAKYRCDGKTKNSTMVNEYRIVDDL